MSAKLHAASAAPVSRPRAQLPQALGTQKRAHARLQAERFFDDEDFEVHLAFLSSAVTNVMAVATCIENHNEQVSRKFASGIARRCPYTVLRGCRGSSRFSSTKHAFAPVLLPYRPWPSHWCLQTRRCRLK